jgi:hypothetical protein
MTAHPRVIVASPDPIECGVVCEWLREEHFEPIRRSDPRTACEEMQNRPFDLLIADELFVFRHQLHQLSRARKPNMPTVVIGDGASADARESRSRQVMYLTRPLDRSLFVCTVALAIADGRPVRCSVRKPVERVNAIVNGVSSHIIDVSNEGLRLEIPRERGAVPLPYFNVLVPLIGVAVTFQRMWMRPASADQADAWWCGGALVRNQARSEQAWRSVVETISVPGGTRSASPRVL